MARVTIKTFHKVVTTAGTQVPLSSTTILARNICIQALASNTGSIYIGESDVSSSDFGVEITAGNSFSIELPSMGEAGSDDIDLKDIWIDAETNGEGVSVTYYTT